MATSKSILDALANVGDEMCEARAIAETFVALNGDDINAPSWPFLLLRMVDRIGKATEDLEAKRLFCLLHWSDGCFSLPSREGRGGVLVGCNIRRRFV